MSKKILLDKKISIPVIKTYEVYRQNGGYASVEKVKMTADEVVKRLKNQDFAVVVGFPAGLKWSFIDKIETKTFVCTDESEPGTFKDRYLMEFIPHLLIEGMITPVPGANHPTSTFVENICGFTKF
jgi:NADH-quinone oxidoreductase subunit F